MGWLAAVRGRLSFESQQDDGRAGLVPSTRVGICCLSGFDAEDTRCEVTHRDMADSGDFAVIRLGRFCKAVQPEPTHISQRHNGKGIALFVLALRVNKSAPTHPTLVLRFRFPAYRRDSEMRPSSSHSLLRDQGTRQSFFVFLPTISKW